MPRTTANRSEQSMLREVRELLSGGRGVSSRLRRLERLERAAIPPARVWVNGRAIGPKPSPPHLYETYD
jgi:hypothetical protein